MTIPVRQALISVSDKAGVVEFARNLAGLGVRILSTGGTAKLLFESGLAVTEVGDYTGFPEMLDGRVKTLHPKIHGGILARRDMPAHLAALSAAQIDLIDLIAVNLYPFVQTISRSESTLQEAIENIDIGGPAMLRAAAKNYSGVAVVCDPADYPALIAEMIDSAGALSDSTRFALAKKVFVHTAAYDAAIGNYLTGITATGRKQAFPDRLTMQFEKVQDMRYGENPHQQAALYRDAAAVPGGLAGYRQIQGKALSYNNIADADAAWECVKSFANAACVIVKHANPCGVAEAASLREAYRKAFSTDPASAFGGIMAFNRELDGPAAEAASGQFVEVVIAPRVGEAARKIFAMKANVRVLEVAPGTEINAFDFKRVGGGLLAQTPDSRNVGASDLKVVTRLQPDAAQMADLLFAWRVAKFVKSNAIVFCGNSMTLGVGAGQMSRIDSARIAAIKAQNAGLPLAGSVVASDAFFPFRDAVDLIAQSGAKAIIQPGGSVRDGEVIAAADELGVAMVFTGIRHFRH